MFSYPSSGPHGPAACVGSRFGPPGSLQPNLAVFPGNPPNSESERKSPPKVENGARKDRSESPNEEGNASDAESDTAASADDDINSIDTEKLDASHREILEKLKRQEQEEREEIERELEEAQREAIIRARHQDEMRAQDLRARELRDHEEGSDRDSPGSPSTQTEIKTQRPKGLLAHHGLAPKSHNNNNNGESKERLHNRDKELPNGSEKDSEHRMPLEHQLSGPGPLDFPHPAFLDRRAFAPSPPSLPGSPSQQAGSRDSTSGSPLGSSTPGHHWTFEEQFKQLYELSDDPKRREFLDDLFCFMQKRGTPVNRIPIMAKQTLDLYELFRLVVSKGGLVEVINKKLWREITKGLNLPSSITSAAFTLRTQYMKYLYPYECEKLKLSNPSELQSAIDGNRREGRRPSYGYEFSPMPSMLPTPPPPPHLNGALSAFNGGRPANGPAGLAALWGAPRGPLKDSPWNIMAPSLHLPHPGDDDMDQPKNLKKEKDSADSRLSTPTGHLRSLERDARAMEAAARAMEEASKSASESDRPSAAAATSTSMSSSRKMVSPLSSADEPPSKRMAMEEDRLMAQMGMRSAHMKITSRGDGRSEFDNSLVVSMEINGIMYQGVLFAQHHPRRI